jgi:hypothetical protein
MAEPIYINDTIKNKYDNSPFRIPLRNKKRVIVEYALVDEDDFEKVNKYKWHLNASGYAQGTIKGKIIPLHHFILKKPEKGYVIDHINQDRLNDSKNNLREVSKSINSHNKIKNTNIVTSSKFKGVIWNKKLKKWRSTCWFKKKQVDLGCFETEEEAAKAYDIYTFKLLGKAANNNNLVEYKDTLNININDLIKKKNSKYDIPKNIDFNKNKYRAKKNYKSVVYVDDYKDTLEEAIKDLDEINQKIELIKKHEEEEYKKTEITRNKDGISFIKVKDLEVLVDEDNWHELNSINWSISRGYIFNNKVGLMHRYVMKAKEDELIDHISKIKHDNRRCNLRSASFGLNAHNKTKMENTSSKYIGVCLKRGYWVSSIKYKGETHYLGAYKDEDDAAKAYNKKALEFYKEKSNLNVFDENESEEDVKISADELYGVINKNVIY